MKKFYITTPLYYVNAPPHIGHSYTNIAADILARYKRLKGYEVFFLTGTDEHGQKVEQAAKKENMTAGEFSDSIVPRFIDLWRRLCVDYDDFIRTTEARHIETVQRVLSLLKENGDLYLGEYTGSYCTPCETFWTDIQIEEEICPYCKRKLERIQEENYFFRMSKYQDWLKDYILKHPGFILPDSRRNEILSFLENPLTDLCISRPKSRLSWGIPLPFSEEHVVYVWFDALINYISGCGYLTDQKKFSKFWPADTHIIGKDILRPHAVYWPIMLHTIGLDMPRMIFAHGWWTLDEEKMSKSKGNIVNPLEIIDKYGTDAYRYFLLRDVPFGLDGNYSEEALVLRLNSDLANDLGNLLHRTLTMTEKYFSGVVPPLKEEATIEELKVEAQKVVPAIEECMERLDFSAALTSIWKLINKANKFIEVSKPWVLAKEKKEDQLSSIVYGLMEVLRIVAVAISPFMPTKAKQMREQMGMLKDFSSVSFSDMQNWGSLPAGTKVNKTKPLFPRIL